MIERIKRDASIVGWEINGWFLVTDAWLRSRHPSAFDQEAIIAAVQAEFAKELEERE